MQLTGLRAPSKYKATLVGKDKLFYKGWGVIENKVTTLSDLAKTYTSNGVADKALYYFKAANMYFYYLHLLICIKEECDTYGYTIDSEEIIEKYKLTCVEENLVCLSKYYGTDYTTTYNNLVTAIFSTDLVVTPTYFTIFDDWYVPTIGDMAEIYTNLMLIGNPGQYDLQGVYGTCTAVQSIGDHNVVALDAAIGVAGQNRARTLPLLTIPVRQFKSPDYSIGDVGPAGGYIYSVSNADVCYEALDVTHVVELPFGLDGVFVNPIYQSVGEGLQAQADLLLLMEPLEDYHNSTVNISRKEYLV
jgi:hypothetical protein